MAPVFSAPGPNIDVNLFANAASAGANLARTIPSIGSSIISGYEQGQQIESNDNKIVQQQQQIQSQDIENQINQLKLQAAQDTQDVNLRLAKTTAENELSTAEQQKKNLVNKDTINQIIASGDITAVQGIYKNPDLLRTLHDDPTFADQTLGGAHQYLDPQQFSQAYQSLGYSKYAKYQEDILKLNADIAGKLYGPKADSLLPPSFNGALSQLDPQHPEQIFSKDHIVIAPTGTKPKNEKGELLTDQADIVIDPVKAKENAASQEPYEMFINKKYAGPLTQDDYAAYSKQQANYSRQQSLIGSGVYGDLFNGIPGLPSINGVTGIGIRPPIKPDSPGGSAPVKTSGPQASTDLANEPTSDPIINNTRATLKEYEKTHPAGSVGTTIEQQIANRKAQIKAAYPSTIAPAVPAVVPKEQALETAPQADRSNFVPVPNYNLSKTMKQNVSLDTSSIPKLHSAMYDRINSDPITYGLPPLIKGMVATESGGVRDATSPTGVRGLLQVTKATAAQYGLNRDIPSENVLAGQLYMHDNMVRFKGNLRLALAAYNVGPGIIREAVNETGSTNWEDIKGYLRETLSPQKFKETSQYPDKVIGYAAHFVQPDTSGLNFAYTLDDNNLLKRGSGPSADTEI